MAGNMLVLFALIATFAIRSFGADVEMAHLLASKNLYNLYLVEGKDLTVVYDIFNVGESSALDVQLVDRSFPAEEFDTVRGSLSVSWPRIGPSTNLTHSVILRPKQAGYYNFTAAEISYLPTETSIERQYGYTSAPGEGGVGRFKDYDRKFSPHILDWLAFVVMTIPSLAIPLMLWRSSSSRYEELSKKN